MQFKTIILSLITLLITSCASINSVSLTPIPADRSQLVTAETSKTIFLGFNFNNDFADNLVGDLKSKCPNGIVSGVLTKDEVIHYFIVHTRKITATGYCIQNVAAQKTK